MQSRKPVLIAITIAVLLCAGGSPVLANDAGETFESGWSLVVDVWAALASVVMAPFAGNLNVHVDATHGHIDPIGSPTPVPNVGDPDQGSPHSGEEPTTD